MATALAQRDWEWQQRVVSARVEVQARWADEAHESRARLLRSTQEAEQLAVEVEALRQSVVERDRRIGKLELPLTEEATASAFFGNATILLVTSVPPK